MDGAGIRQNAGNPQETGCSHGPTDASDLRPQSVCAILRRARGALHDGEVTLGEVVEALGRASFAPLIMLPALIVVTPASGIPLLSSICGITIALIAGQMLVQRDHIWLPRWLMRRSVSREKLQKALDWLDPIAAWVDRITKERLTPLVNPPFLYVLQLLCVAGGAVMPLMEFVPFTSSMMGVMVAFLSVAMVTRDGLLVLFGFSALGGLFYLANMVLA
ncbi:exopolysaccharide biosynthesis protein [uncultured Maritimibacter sp.]|uniref:exopolysaccharide biosynthesis protein n=1 Tax=uncultured Maritimibacter sp. TaxID=991866 RepID=UPI00262973AB|nr:exopolysaccharide biosynthesis protein [uncultured Maritimibacter sp.]